MNDKTSKKTIEKIFVTAELLLEKLQGEQLEELQKALLLQSLVMAKIKLEELTIMLSETNRTLFEKRLDELTQKIQTIMSETDFVQVQDTLERLSSGMVEMAQMNAKGSVIRE